MSDKFRRVRDAFGFSLRGLRTAASHTAAMAVADDGINAAWDEQFEQARKKPAGEAPGFGNAGGRFWLSRRYRAR